jgi:hypothetical protein
MPKYIIQKHEKQGEPVHWDLMLEHDDVLKTFRIDRPPERWNDEVAQAIPIFDHEKRFLTYEGPVNKGLGHVEIVERGGYQTVSQTLNSWHLDLQGTVLRGAFVLRGVDAHSWTLTMLSSNNNAE